MRYIIKAVDRPEGAPDPSISAVVDCKYCDFEHISSYSMSSLRELLTIYPAIKISTEWQAQKYQMLVV